MSERHRFLENESGELMIMSGGLNVVMTTIAFSVSTLFVVFVFTRLICARIHLRLARRSAQITASGSNFGSMERGMHGLEPVVIAKIPVKKYNDEYFSSVVNAQCIVCLGEYNPEDKLRILPYCGHYFHLNCIDIWLLQHCTCPVCRISLREVSEKKRSMQPMFSSRSNYREECPAMHCHCCSLPCHICTSRSQGNNRGTSPVSNSDAEEAGEAIRSENDLSADVTLEVCEKKHVDSPLSQLVAA